MFYPRFLRLLGPLFFGMAVVAVAQPELEVIDFEEGVGGLSGPIAVDRSGAHGGQGAGRIEADLANVTQSAWVTVTKPLKLAKGIEQMSFWVKSREANRITVRLTDATGQKHQIRPPLDASGEWQEVVIDSFEQGPGHQSYGGAEDKTVHWPAKSLSFIVEKSGLDGGGGTVWLDDVTLTLSEKRAIGELDVRPEKPGNVFLTNEAVRLAVDTQGDRVRWSVVDFWGREIAKGEEPVSGQAAVVKPEVAGPGYYEARLAAMQGGKVLAEGVSPFVVLTPFDLAGVKESPFGVMTHFAQSWETDVMPLIALAGVKHIRDELYWAHIEAKKGEFVFKEAFEKYMAEAKANHLDPLIALTFGNPNYDHTSNAPGYGNAPFTDEGRNAYTRYGQKVLEHYGRQIGAVEIWNEYNGTFGRGPAAKDKPGYYFAMLKDAYEGIKQVRPDVTVVGISAVATPFPYFEDLFKRGALNYMDALSLHPYRTQGTPEGLDRLMMRLQNLIGKYSKGRPMPVWITELGWYVKSADDRSDLVVTEADQAKYLVRGITLTVSAGIERFYWYHARDDQSFPSSGILRGPGDPKGRYAPKPSYAAYATLTRQLTGAKFDRREPAVNDEVYSMLFRKGGEEVRVMWSLAPAMLSVKADGPLELVSLVGETRTLKPTGGEVKLELGDTPVYLKGSIAGLPPMAEAIGEVVADSEEDFSGKQGEDGWSYGYFVAPRPGAAYDPAAWKPFPRYNVTIWGYEWLGDLKHLTITPANAHPGVDGGKPIWAVRRWTSDVAGNVQLKGRFGRPAKGDGTTARIFVDGREVWKRQIAGGEPVAAKFELTVPVKVGSAVDFSVDPGPGTDTSHDATSMSVKITALAGRPGESAR